MRVRSVEGRVQHAHVNGRHTEKQGRSEIEQLGSGGAVVEALHEAHAAPAGEPAVQAVAKGVNVKERKCEEKAIRSGDLPTGQQIDRIGLEVVVGENGALRRAGRT